MGPSDSHAAIDLSSGHPLLSTYSRRGGSLVPPRERRGSPRSLGSSLCSRLGHPPRRILRQLALLHCTPASSWPSSPRRPWASGKNFSWPHAEARSPAHLRIAVPLLGSAQGSLAAGWLSPAARDFHPLD